jgi:1,4-alpha-glucan branching enzyme
MSDLSTLRIPVIGADKVWLRLASLPREGTFKPDGWRHAKLSRTRDDWWEIDLSTLNLTDGAYEYEFVVDWADGKPSQPVADPYAEQATRFSGYRGVLHIRDGNRVRLGFSWDNELQSGPLPYNNEMVIYELPMRWVDAGEDGQSRQVGLGTFEKALFERLWDGASSMRALGVNCIELLPVQDSPDTLNWGYGTRFFFAPDYDMGEPFDLKLFIKHCHQHRIRVILDLVMNHAKKCPLRDLAFDKFFLRNGNEEPGPDNKPRDGWGGNIFRYRAPVNGVYYARDFHYGMAKYLIKEYHIDGFRLDEFKGIDNYDFIREFTRRAHDIHRNAFPGRPFIVIAEDSWRRAGITEVPPSGTPVVDSMWDFAFRDDIRRLVSNTLWTALGNAARSKRVRRLFTIGDTSLFWPGEEDRGKQLFTDLSKHVVYPTSHDVEKDDEQRLSTYFSQKLREAGWAEADISGIAFEQVHSAMALTLTAPGIPMFLAGEEFGDLHDTDRKDWRQKMSDPVDWYRQDLPSHANLLRRVRQMVGLRTSHRALQWNDTTFFGFSSSQGPGFHPTFDENDGERLFAYCRTAGQGLGARGQVIIIANCSPRSYPSVLVDWPWGYQSSLTEYGSVGQPYPYISGQQASVAMGPFQVRVFSV